MPSILELNCLILGEDASHLFSVKIDSTESVFTLKEVIKDKKSIAFQHVDANSLILWKVSIPVDSEFKDKIGELKLDDKKSLLAVDRLSKLFSDVPQDG